jgi:hypothetical protein
MTYSGDESVLKIGGGDHPSRHRVAVLNRYAFARIIGVHCPFVRR